ncbi:hypothetical protein PybrP1_008789 [[Pythium] brassicae (nom. inval.)]|nr:hypothetical protein PybrP1_008789 [[Pythium] brassicae (nom. inval.)]
MVFSSAFVSVVTSTMSFMAYCKGFGGKTVDAKEFSWSYLEREGKEQDATDAVVFLHGFSSMKESWVRVASGVDRRFQVLIPDLPGQGRTTPAEASFSYSVDQQAQRLDQFLATTVPADKKVHLVGCSMGGMIAGVYAAKYPDRVRSLTMVCPAGISMRNKSDGLRILEDTGRNLLLAHTPEDINEMIKLIDNSAHHMPSFVASAIGAERLKQMHVYEKIVADCLTEPTVLEQYLPQIKAKTFVLWGKQDRVLDVSCVEKLDELLAVDRKHILVMDNCGHTLQHEKHRELTHSINQFLNDKVPTGTPA